MRMTLRVLVVDPCPDTVASLSWLLSRWGYEVRTARTGPIALELAQSFEPDAVLSEIVVPGMNGFDLASRLRRDAARPLLVAVTGRGTEADRQRSLAAGFHCHLVKPADPAVLQQLLASWAAYRMRGCTASWGWSASCLQIDIGLAPC
jgi:CheY-like chemotaxis protein